MPTDVTFDLGIFADGVGGTKDPSAIIQSDSTTQGVSVPRMTTTQRNAISSPLTGLEIFNTTTNQKEINTGTPTTPVWVAIGGGISASSTDTLINKTIDADNNTITNIGLAEIDADVNSMLDIFIGASLLSASVSVASNGTIITLSLENAGGGDIDVIFGTGVVTVDCTPALTVSLTAGSDTAPTLNYVFILASAPTIMTTNTTGFPATEHFPVATALCQSAATLQTKLAYKVHAWTDHIKNGDVGHISHLNQWVRSQHASHISGVDQSYDITPNGGSADNVILTTASGLIRQLHEHAFPAFSSTPDIYVVNGATPYAIVTDWNVLLTDSEGGSLSGRRFSHVCWGSVNEETGDCKLFLNLPSGSYNSDAAVIADSSNFANRTIPNDFIGTGFLISEWKLRHQSASSGTWTSIQEVDLRKVPPASSGSSGVAGATEFEDSAFRINDNGDNTKQIAFEASGITTGTARTATMPDADITLGTDADAIHDNVPSEISPLTEKVTPIAGDHILIEDSADSNNKKRVQVGNLPSSGGAPVSSTYIVQTADGTLTNEQAMGALATGIVKNTTTTGVQSIAVANTDFAAPTHAERHLTGTTDEIDGDKLDIDFAPTNSIPSITPAEADNLDNLTAHLAGIDDAIAPSTQTSSGVIEIATSAETNTGTDASRAVSPDGLDDWTGSAQIDTLGTIATAVYQGTAINQTYLVGQSGTNTGDEASASVTVEGISELATTAETSTGTDTARTIPVSALPLQIQDSKYTYVLTTGSANAYLASFTPTPSTYVNGQVFYIKASFANTGAATLAINGQAAKAIVTRFNVALVANDIVSGMILAIAYDSTGDNLQMLSPVANAAAGGGGGTSIAILTDQKTSGTNGGGSGATSQNARNLNTELTDADNIVTISSNQFTPVSGDFRIQVSAIANAANQHRLRLFNVTSASVVKTGMNAFSVSSVSSGDIAYLDYKFTANGTDAYRIDHYTQLGKSGDGLGIQIGNGDVETYMIIRLEKE